MNKNQPMWQYMSPHYGGMGWFNETDKNELEKTDTEPHTWRKIPQSEVDSMNAIIGQLAYEQS